MHTRKSSRNGVYTMPERTYARQPDAEKVELTADMIIGPDMTKMVNHYISYLSAKKRNDPLNIPFNDSERIDVIAIYRALRLNGYYVAGIDERKNLIFGRRLKSDLQMEMEKNAEKYQQRGEELRANGHNGLVKTGLDGFSYTPEVNPDTGECYA